MNLDKNIGWHPADSADMEKSTMTPAPQQQERDQG
jgi:hypothetical protein